MVQTDCLVRTGIVKEKKGNALKVCFERAEACASCRGCAEGFRRKSELLTVYGDAQIGDTVEVRIPTGRLMQSVLLVFAIPAALFLAGLGLGAALRLPEGVTGLAALAGLTLGWGLVKFLEKRLGLHLRWRPTVSGVIPNDQKKEGAYNE